MAANATSSSGDRPDNTCDNCAIDIDDRVDALVAVHRIYPAYDDQPERRLDATEWWCVSCVTQYPNELASDADDLTQPES